MIECLFGVLKVEGFCDVLVKLFVGYWFWWVLLSGIVLKVVLYRLVDDWGRLLYMFLDGLVVLVRFVVVLGIKFGD